VKHESREASGSRRSKSGSICGYVRIEPLEKTRINAERNGSNAAKTGFYHGKKSHLTRLEREHDRRETKLRGTRDAWKGKKRIDLRQLMSREPLKQGGERRNVHV